MRRKVLGLYLGSSPQHGGAHQYNMNVLEALQHLDPARFDVRAVYLDPQWAPMLQNGNARPVHVAIPDWRRRLNGALFHAHTPHALLRRLVPLFHPVARTFEAMGCDLAIYPSQDIWSFCCRVPALSTIHDLMHRYESFPEMRSQKSLRDHLYSGMVRHSRGILVDSQVGREQVVECYGADPQRVHVLPFAAPPYIGGAVPPLSPAVEARLPAKFLFYPAQFWEHKNHAGLLDAMGLVRDELPDLHLVLVGSAKNAGSRLEERIRFHGLQERVTILGYVSNEDMGALYGRARAMVMPSFCGPTNIPPLEAFASGCPAAVADVYGMAEQAGGAALLFDPRSPSSMAEVLRQLWLDDGLCRELAEKGHRRTQELSVDHFCRNLQGVVLSILGEES